MATVHADYIVGLSQSKMVGQSTQTIQMVGLILRTDCKPKSEGGDMVNTKNVILYGPFRGDPQTTLFMSWAYHQNLSNPASFRYQVQYFRTSYNKWASKFGPTEPILQKFMTLFVNCPGRTGPLSNHRNMFSPFNIEKENQEKSLEQFNV